MKFIHFAGREEYPLTPAWVTIASTWRMLRFRGPVHFYDWKVWPWPRLFAMGKVADGC